MSVATLLQRAFGQVRLSWTEREPRAAARYRRRRRTANRRARAARMTNRRRDALRGCKRARTNR